MTKEQVAKVLGPTWAEKLWSEFNQPYMGHIQRTVKQDREIFGVWPESKNVLRAFTETPYDELKVVIIGQDPYHTPGLANGLAFSVTNDLFEKDVPPSLKNILKEVEDDCGFRDPVPEWDLTRWAKQGVLLLNRSLTVREHIAGSHSQIGWFRFTDRVVEAISEGERQVVFLLWGRHAQSAAERVDPFKHWLIKTPHPSPLSAYRGFFGSRCFSECNSYLVKEGRDPIIW